MAKKNEAEFAFTHDRRKSCRFLLMFWNLLGFTSELKCYRRYRQCSFIKCANFTTFFIHFSWKRGKTYRNPVYVFLGQKAACLFVADVVDSKAIPRETREGWPLLTVETEAIGDFNEYKKGPSLVGSLGSSCRYKICLSCIGCSGPVQNTFFPRHTLFHFISPHCPKSWACRRAGWPVS